MYFSRIPRHSHRVYAGGSTFFCWEQFYDTAGCESGKRMCFRTFQRGWNCLQFCGLQMARLVERVAMGGVGGAPRLSGGVVRHRHGGRPQDSSRPMRGSDSRPMWRIRPACRRASARGGDGRDAGARHKGFLSRAPASLPCHVEAREPRRVAGTNGLPCDRVWQAPCLVAQLSPDSMRAKDKGETPGAAAGAHASACLPYSFAALSPLVPRRPAGLAR